MTAFKELHRCIGLRCIVVDAFGTIVKPVSPIGAYHKVLKQSTDFRWARHAALTENMNLRDLSQKLALPPPTEEMMTALQIEISNIEPYEDSLSFLENAKSAGLKIAVCSNLAYEYGTPVKTIFAEFVDYFSFSFEVGFAKPEPEIYADVCSHLAVLPEEAFFIGDTPDADLTGPTNFGMMASLLKRKDGETLFDCLHKDFNKKSKP